MLDDALLRAYYRNTLEKPGAGAMDIDAIRALARRKAASKARRFAQLSAAALGVIASVSVAIAYSPPLQHSISDAFRRFETVRPNQRFLQSVRAVTVEQAKRDASFALQPPAGIPDHSRLVEVDEVHAHGATFFWFTYLNRKTGQHFSVTIAPKTTLALRFHVQAQPGVAKHHRIAPFFHGRWSEMRTYFWLVGDEIVTVPQNSLTDYEISTMRRAMHGTAL